MEAGSLLPLGLVQASGQGAQVEAQRSNLPAQLLASLRPALMTGSLSSHAISVAKTKVHCSFLVCACIPFILPLGMPSHILLPKLHFGPSKCHQGLRHVSQESTLSLESLQHGGRGAHQYFFFTYSGSFTSTRSSLSFTRFLAADRSERACIPNRRISILPFNHSNIHCPALVHMIGLAGSPILKTT